jgi:hypothetical protein
MDDKMEKVSDTYARCGIVSARMSRLKVGETALKILSLALSWGRKVSS